MTVNQLKAALDGCDPHAPVVFDDVERWSTDIYSDVWPMDRCSDVAAVETAPDGRVVLREVATVPAAAANLERV